MPSYGLEGKDFYLVGTSGKYCLLRDSDTIVPPDYDLILPALQENFAFIVLDDKIGLYDIEHQQELYLSGDFDELKLFETANGGYLLECEKNPDYLSYYKSGYFKIDSTGNFTPSNTRLYKTNYPENGHYENSILRLNENEVIHNHGYVHWRADTLLFDNKRALNYRLEKSIQHSGLFNLKTHQFEIPGTYIKIEPIYKYENQSYSMSLCFYRTVTQGGPYFREFKENDFVLPDYQETIRYGLIDTDYTMVLNPQEGEVHPTETFGGFYTVSPSRTAVYGPTGGLLLELNGFNNYVQNVIITLDKFDIITYGETTEQMEMNVQNHFIYSDSGTFIKKETMGLISITNLGEILMVITLKDSNDFDIGYGLYDLDKMEFVVSPVYDWIMRSDYARTLFHCPEEKCHTFFTCSKGDSLIYFDEDLNRIYPEKVIDKDIYSSFENNDFYGEFEGYRFTPIMERDDDALVEQLELKNIHVQYEVTGMYHEDFYQRNYYGLTTEKLEQLTIIAVYYEPNSPPFYGLAYAGEVSFILPPVFDSITFDTKQKNIHFNYGGETWWFPISRYER